MRPNFVPSKFKVPVRINFGKEHYLVSITTNDLVEDWQTLLNNADAITKVRGGSGSKKEWPYVCSLEEDYKDLAWLQTCAKYKQLFSYIIRSNKDDSYMGCIYIYPIEMFYEDKKDKYDVDFSFWITQSELDKGKYGQISKELMLWLTKYWPFDKKRIFFRNKLVPREIKNFLD